ncbi:MAG: hypothetical protein R6V01_01485 [Thermoplasmatota archaeon]
MIKKKTNAVLIMLNILFILLIVIMVTGIIMNFAVQLGGITQVDPYDPGSQEELQQQSIAICGLACGIGLFGLGVIGLLIAIGIVMIVSRKDYDGMEKIGLTSGIVLLSSLGAAFLFALIPYINIVLLPVANVALFGSIIFYLYGLNSKKGRTISFVAAGFLGGAILLGLVNSIWTLFTELGETNIFLLVISTAGALLWITGLVLLMVIVSKVKENLERDEPSGFEDLSGPGGGTYGERFQPGKLQGAQDDWLSYDTTENASLGPTDDWGY